MFTTSTMMNVRRLSTHAILALSSEGAGAISFDAGSVTGIEISEQINNGGAGQPIFSENYFAVFPACCYDGRL